MNSFLTRRRFIQSTAVAMATVSSLRIAAGATQASRRKWTIGCLNRPWVKWSVDEMLDGVKSAGYRTVGLQTPTRDDPFVAASATAEYLAALKRKIAARGLTANQGRLRTEEATPEADAKTAIRRQLENARTLGLKTVINTGTSKPEHYDAWYKLMAFAAAYAADRGIQVVTKPHGGVTAAASDLIVCLEKIRHPNFSIWYDAGNILHYTGKDPLAELEPIISHVTAFTAKDCAGKRGAVMIQFGEGNVDFTAIFRRLNKARFDGPIMVESCLVGETPEATTANARANRAFLEKAIAAI